MIPAARVRKPARRIHPVLELGEMQLDGPVFSQDGETLKFHLTWQVRFETNGAFALLTMPGHEGPRHARGGLVTISALTISPLPRGPFGFDPPGDAATAIRALANARSPIPPMFRGVR
jgi:hypothetical protein